MTQTYPLISSTKFRKPVKPRKPVERKIKTESHFCSKNKGKKCTCSKRH